MSIGNIGQLSIDLIINSFLNLNNKNNINYKIEKIGYFNTNCLLPIIGYNTLDNENNEICINSELFYINELNIVLFQQRSPIINGKGKKYIQELTEFILSNKFSKIIMIGGIDSSVQNVDIIGSSNIMYFSTINEELTIPKYKGITINNEKSIELYVYI